MEWLIEVFHEPLQALGLHKHKKAAAKRSMKRTVRKSSRSTKTSRLTRSKKRR